MVQRAGQRRRDPGWEARRGGVNRAVRERAAAVRQMGCCRTRRAGS